MNNRRSFLGSLVGLAALPLTVRSSVPVSEKVQPQNITISLRSDANFVIKTVMDNYKSNAELRQMIKSDHA
jgi:hypothetical protein